MPSQRDSSTEEKILAAAEEIFHEKGFDGARMQEIADKAAINKGLLHYYFKSKDALFNAIFSMAIRRMVGNLNSILLLDIPLEEKIDLMVDGYMNLLLKNSSLPAFVINELNKDPDTFIAKHVDGNFRKVFEAFIQSVNKDVQLGKIRPIDPRQLFINIQSMVLFPFVARPMIQVVIGLENKDYRTLLGERRELIKAFVRQALQI